ncbi:hypothetical protein [Streptomyces sp. NRRL S-646]|uniref:hypothetical protein n=1 Tax=Streptomyces sp. NRRL S-646 TaxID=1463917 RepID=UPI0007C579F1|nr:hypothetical protein [Streptomyces sp. NRRL S-646]
MLLVARTSGSPAAAGLTGGAPAGQVACGPLVGQLADRHGRRTVVLAFSLANAAAIAALVAGALDGLSVPSPALLGAVAGATVPLIGPLGRARLVAPVRSPRVHGRRGALLREHPRRDLLRPGPGPGGPGRRARAPRPPRSVLPLRAALALQGAMFGACQAGVTALTERLGQEQQAGLVYAAMGVMSAVAGLSMTAVPARIPLTAR